MPTWTNSGKCQWVHGLYAFLSLSICVFISVTTYHHRAEEKKSFIIQTTREMQNRPSEKKARDTSFVAKAYVIPAPIRDVIVPFGVLRATPEEQQKAQAEEEAKDAARPTSFY